MIEERRAEGAGAMGLKEVAARAGVSVSTASRVLDGRFPKFATEPVRARVFAAARETGYTPSAAARALRAGEAVSMPRVALAVSRRLDSDRRNAFFSMLERAVSEEIMRQGAALGPVRTLDALLRADPAEPMPDAVVVMGRCAVNTARLLTRRVPSAVFVGLNPYTSDVDQVISDGRVAAEMAVSYLISRGHSAIGYVGECDAEIRYQGYKATLLRHKLPFKREWVFETHQSEQGGETAAARMLRLSDRPDALFCANDATALGVLRTLGARAAWMPAMISIDDIEEGQSGERTLTTIHIPVAQMGAMAVKMLFDRMRGGHTSPLRVEFPGHVVPRRTS